MKKNLIVIVIIILVIFQSGCVSNQISDNFCDNKTIVMEGDKIGLNKDFAVTEEDDVYKTSFDFNGTYTLWEFESLEDQELNFDYKLDLTSGAVRLVLIDPENNITDLVLNSLESDSIITSNIDLTAGKYRLKLLGKKDAAGDLMLKIDRGIVTGVDTGGEEHD